MSRIYQPQNSSANKHAVNHTTVSTVTSTSSSQSSSTSVSPTVSNNNLVNNRANLHHTTTATTKVYVNNPISSNHNINLDEKKVDNNNPKMASDLEKLIARLETVTNRLESVSQSAPSRLTNGTSAQAQAQSVSNGVQDTTEELPSIVAFDDLLNNTFKSFKDLSSKIGQDVQTIVGLVEKVFKYQRQFLVEAARSVQPSQDVWMKFLQQFSKFIEEVQTFREKNRQSQLFNHLSALSESIGAFGWIAVTPAPSPYVKEMSDAAQFYTNRVLKDYKEKDPNHVNWVKLWLQTLSELQAYVKQHHTTGVVWNSSKKSSQFDPSRVNLSGSSSSSAPVAPTLAPPPPPPPMPSFNDLFADDAKSSRPSGPSHEALFAELNKGSDITRHLKQVTDDQKTHKNPTLRAGNVVPSGPASATSSTASLNSKPTAAVQKPPVFELQDKKWKVEYQTNRNDLVIEDTDLKQTVYIFQCKECTITVKGKVNSIIIDSCSRVGLLFDDVLSTIEFINSKNVQMQVLGKVPTVSIEKTDGCQVYLSKSSLQTEIVSSKSSSMNILVPNQHDDDYTEHPVPEQFKTVINASRKLVTTPTEAV